MTSFRRGFRLASRSAQRGRTVGRRWPAQGFPGRDESGNGVQELGQAPLGPSGPLRPPRGRSRGSAGAQGSLNVVETQALGPPPPAAPGRLPAPSPPPRTQPRVCWTRARVAPVQLQAEVSCTDRDRRSRLTWVDAAGRGHVSVLEGHLYLGETQSLTDSKVGTTEILFK